MYWKLIWILIWLAFLWFSTFWKNEHIKLKEWLLWGELIIAIQSKRMVDIKSFTKIPHDPFSLTLRACIVFLSSTLPISFSSWFPTFYPVCSFQVLFLFVHIILFFCLCSYARLNFYETPKRFHIDLSTWCIMMPQFKSPSMLSNNVKINIYVCMMYVYVNLTNLQHKLDTFFIAILMNMLGGNQEGNTSFLEGKVTEFS